MKLALFDLDGVLADDRHRVPFALEKRWVDYFRADRVLQDPLWPQGEATLRSMEKDGWTIAYMTGRRESMRLVTRRWLREAGLPEGPLYMRSVDDQWYRLGEYKVRRIRGLRSLSKIGDDVVLFDDDPEVIAAVCKAFGGDAAIHCTWQVKEKAMVHKARF